MRHNFNLGILALALILMLNASALSQKSKKYPVRTLEQIISLNRDGTDQVFAKATLDEPHEFIGIDPMNSMVKLQLVEGPRTISHAHHNSIDLWGKLKRIDKKFLELYTDEFLFKENDIEYWIPIQTKDKDAIASKFHPGDTITLTVLYVGARKEKDESRFHSLFLSTAFEP
jgi:hypothetical protein